MKKKFTELQAGMDPERLARSKERAKETIAEMLLAVSPGVRMCEGISAMWRYHLCLKDDDTGARSLCGRMTMSCNSRIESWGLRPDHMPTSYCSECEEIALRS